MHEDRDRFDNEVLMRMSQTMEFGGDPMDVLRHVMAMGYGEADIVRLLLKFEAMILAAIEMRRQVNGGEIDQLDDEAIEAGGKALVVALEDYLKKTD